MKAVRDYKYEGPDGGDASQLDNEIHLEKLYTSLRDAQSATITVQSCASARVRVGMVGSL